MGKLAGASLKYRLMFPHGFPLVVAERFRVTLPLELIA
jgi:hypothetical protein